MTLDVSTVLILERWVLPLGEAGCGHFVTFDVCSSSTLVTYILLFLKTPAPEVEKQVVFLASPLLSLSLSLSKTKQKLTSTFHFL